MKRKIGSALLCAVMALSLSLPALATEDTNNDITILYTNDVHTYIDNGVNNANGLTYAKLATLRKTEDALLVDAGDHIQGTAYGSMDKGSTIIELMNATGYSIATPGNHEFDYGMEGFLKVVEQADFPYISCNFYALDPATGERTSVALNGLATTVINGKTIAFIGITTPETFTSSTPAYFQNEKGEYIYDIAGGEDGSDLYQSVQYAIDAVKTYENADYIIALGHLGVDASSGPWTSRELIAHTSGLDAFIDGHSHTTIESETVSDRDGNPVILTQTGSYLNAVGKLTISADGTITTKLLTGADLADITPDEEVKAIEDRWIAEIEEKLGTVIGYADVTLDNYDSDGTRLVRKQSTNSGDFAADALYHLFLWQGMEVDAAIMNGGGIRNTAVSGELTYLSCKQIHTFGNVACLQAVSGQQLLDALEWGAKDISADGTVENGGFLQVSGIKYTIDASIPSTVQKDEKGVWAGSPTGEYRVKNVEIWSRKTNRYEPLDVTATYNLAGYNYTLRDLGDGFAMFEGAVNILDYVAEDYMVLASYIQSFPVNSKTGLPTLASDSGYADVNGSGRITILDGSEKTADTVYTVVAGDSLWKIAKRVYGNGNAWSLLYEANRGILTNPSQIFVGQTLTIPTR